MTAQATAADALRRAADLVEATQAWERALHGSPQAFAAHDASWGAIKDLYDTGAPALRAMADEVGARAAQHRNVLGSELEVGDRVYRHGMFLELLAPCATLAPATDFLIGFNTRFPDGREEHLNWRMSGVYLVLRGTHPESERADAAQARVRVLEEAVASIAAPLIDTEADTADLSAEDLLHLISSALAGGQS